LSTVNQVPVSPQVSKLQITVTPSDYKKEVDDKVKEYARKARLPGFRNGKVPSGVIRRMFGDQIITEALNHAVNAGINNYLRESGLQILGDPIPDESVRPELDIAIDKDYQFAYDVGVRPDFDLTQTLAGARLTRYIVKADDEMIDKEIERLRERHGEVAKPEVAGEGDIIHVHLTELENGQVKVGGLHEHAAIWVRDLKPDVLPQFIGKKPEDEIDADVFDIMDKPEEVIREKVLSIEPGIEVGRMFRIRIGNISRVTKADIGQKLFDAVYGEGIVTGEFDFRERVTQDLRTALEQGTRMRLESDIFEYMVNSTPMNLPEDFLKRWLLHENKDLSDKDLEKEFSPFIRNLKWNLIVNRLQDAKGLHVTKEEIPQRLKELVMSQYGLNEDTEESRHELEQAVSHLMEDEDRVKRTYESIRDNRIFAFLKQTLRTEEKIVSLEEFKTLTETK